MFDSYFSARYVLSKKAILNIAFSDRSDGKTFDCAQRALEDYEASRNITIYMRRFKSELTSNIYDSFFARNLMLESNDRFKDWTFKGSRRGIQVKLPDSDTWDWIVLFCPLTMSGKMKSSFDGYTNRIHMIDFDEYIPLDDRYAVNEMNLILEFWKSIDRDRNSTQMIILGNRITNFNPVFDYFNIQMDITNAKCKTYKNGSIAVQIYINKTHRKAREATLFNELINNTSYESYERGGVLEAPKFKVGNHNNCQYFASFKSVHGEGSIWNNSKYFVISEQKRGDGIQIVDKPYNNKREQYSITIGHLSSLFRDLYKRNKLCYESLDCYRKFEPLMRMIYSHI